MLSCSHFFSECFQDKGPCQFASQPTAIPVAARTSHQGSKRGLESASVGVILDSSVIIAAERRGRTVRQILEQVRASQGDIEIGLSVVTVAELVHGAYRAAPTQQEQRLAFIERLCRWSAVLRRVVFCQSRLLPAVSLCLKCSTFK